MSCASSTLLWFSVGSSPKSDDRAESLVSSSRLRSARLKYRLMFMIPRLGTGW